jgi:hypothetical protein
MGIILIYGVYILNVCVVVVVVVVVLMEEKGKGLSFVFVCLSHCFHWSSVVYVGTI